MLAIFWTNSRVFPSAFISVHQRLKRFFTIGPKLQSRNYAVDPYHESHTIAD
jgi:hypothetical protein